MKAILNSKITIRVLAAALVIATALALILPVMVRAEQQLSNPDAAGFSELELINAGISTSSGSDASSGDSGENGSAGVPGGTDGTGGGSRVTVENDDSAGGIATTEKELNVVSSNTGGTGNSGSDANASADKDLSNADIGKKPTEPDKKDETENGNTGENGTTETDIDLGAVLTWYKYGSEPKTVVCEPDGTVGGTVLQTQLKNGDFSYRFDLTGGDSDDAKITGVTVQEGAGSKKSASQSGSLVMSEGPGGTAMNYIFTVTASVSNAGADGKASRDDVTFVFVMKYENGIDLELNMSWTKKSGAAGTVICQPGVTAAETVKNTELTGGELDYELFFSGSMADNAKIISAEYTTASGGAGTLTEQGKLPMSIPAGGDRETYTISVYARVKTSGSGEEEVVFTITLSYITAADVSLELTWYKKSTTAQKVTCELNGEKSMSIKYNELNNSSFQYYLAFKGDSASNAKITSVKMTGSSGTKSLDYPQGSASFAIRDGAASAVYRMLVTAELTGDSGRETVTFSYTITYKSDVSLEMRYTTRINGASVENVVVCENNRSKTAGIIFNDQLSDGWLDYSFSITGDDGGNVTIEKISLYQSGSMKTKVLAQDVGSGSSAGSTQLLLKGDRMGENQFTITAKGADGTKYSFSINIPYMPRGNKEVVIKTNITDGQTVENETFFDLTVNAYSVDEAGSVVSHIRPTGSETELKVTLDGEVIAYSGTSGYTAQYRLYPKNPEVGDTNTHVLVIYARDEYGNENTVTYNLNGKRTVDGDVIGKAKIYIDMTVLGLGVYGPVSYDIMANEPISYVIAKSVWGEDTGEPYGAAASTFGWDRTRCTYGGTLDIGFYLMALGDGSNMGSRARAVTAASFESLGGTEEEILAAIDSRLGAGSNLAILWRCIYRNGIPLKAPATYSLGEFNYTKGSGWLYSVNGYYPGAGMSEYTLKDGDTLTLRYTLAYGWDVGSSGVEGNSVGYCISAANGSFSVNHQYETVTNDDGSVSYKCRCCGTVQECPHEHTEWRDNGDGTCGEFCTDCNKYTGELTEHQWEYTQDQAGENHIKTCKSCHAEESEAHDWIRGTDTATCTEPGSVDLECEICGFKKTEATPAKGHIYSDRWEVTAGEHYQKCQVCGLEIEGTRGSHAYVDDGMGGWECSVCRAYHDWDCGGSLTQTSGDCTHKTYVCGSCGLTFVKYGSFHTYENGICTVCGAAEPSHASETRQTADERRTKRRGKNR